MLKHNILECYEKSKKNISWNVKIAQNFLFSIHKWYYWNTANFIHFCMVYGCFRVTMAEVNKHDRDCVNVKSIKYLLSGLLRKNVPTTVLDTVMKKRNTIFQLSKYGSYSVACTPFWPENKMNLYRLPFLSLLWGQEKNLAHRKKSI